MMRHHFEQAHREGLNVSALHASEPGIYGRHGYGLASLELQVELGRGTTFTAPHLDDEAAALTTRLATVDDDGVAAAAAAGGPRPAADKRRARSWATTGSTPSSAGSAPRSGATGRAGAGAVRGPGRPRRRATSCSGASTSGPTRGRPRRSTSGGCSGGRPPGWRCSAAWSTSTWPGPSKVHGIGEDDPLLSWVQGPRGLGDRPSLRQRLGAARRPGRGPGRARLRGRVRRRGRGGRRVGSLERRSLADPGRGRHCRRDPHRRPGRAVPPGRCPRRRPARAAGTCWPRPAPAWSPSTGRAPLATSGGRPAPTSVPTPGEASER